MPDNSITREMRHSWQLVEQQLGMWAEGMCEGTQTAAELVEAGYPMLARKARDMSFGWTPMPRGYKKLSDIRGLK